MDRETQKRFCALWMAVPKRKLSSIADELGYSFQSLAKWRMILGLPKRYGAEDDGETPPPAVIRLRAQAQQTNWTPGERRLRWRGTPHTIYQSISTHDYEP
jgi:hypothetical protein